MKWIKRYFLLRRQNDVVKIITILFIICAYCMISSITSGICFYIKQNVPVSYNFEGISVTDTLLNKIKENKNIIQATPKKTESISFLVNGTTIDLECLKISKEYLYDIMGIENFGSNLFYANRKAMDMIAKGKNQSIAKYITQSEDGKASNKKCQIVLLPDKDGIESDIPMVYSCGSSLDLKEATEAIIHFRKHDLDGSITQYLSNKGLLLSDKETVATEKAALNETLLVIKYRVILFALCFMNGWLLKKYALKLD